MSGLELLEKYPRAASVIRNWLVQRLVEALQNESIDEEFKQYMRDQGIDNDKVGAMIDANPRMLFDAFDEYEIFIGTNVTQKDAFHCTINNSLSPGGTHYTRKEAELFAIDAAFDILENKLTPKEETDENE
jgi:hypothetical protein